MRLTTANGPLLLVLASAVLLLGCSTTQQAMQVVSVFQGRSVDDFFRAYGMPVSAYEFDDGGRVYRWSSGVQVVHMPGTTTYSGKVDAFGNVRGSSTTSGGFDAQMECVIDIHADKDKRVVKIVPVRDTWGAWESSRCHEVFK